MNDGIAIEPRKPMLAVGLDPIETPSVDFASVEAALGRRHGDTLTGEQRRVFPSRSMNGMTLWHRQKLPGATAR